MKPLYDFIVNVPELYRDSVKVGDLDLVLDTRFDDFEGRIAYGKIVALPLKARDVDPRVEVGDTLIFHHHINQQPEEYGIGDDNYLVAWDYATPNGQAYAAMKESGEIIMLGDWIFLLATSEAIQENTTESGIFLGNVLEEVSCEALVYCTGDGTDELGIGAGDKVRYTKNHDYRINLPNGDQVFRMKPSGVIFVYETDVE